MHRFYWRLLFADESVQDELDEGSSLREARRGAFMLQVTAPTRDGRRAVHQVRMMDELEHQYRPVFYRIMSIGIDGSPSMEEATVFGRGRESDEGFSGLLKTFTSAGQVVDVPERWIDRMAVLGLTR